VFNKRVRLLVKRILIFWFLKINLTIVPRVGIGLPIGLFPSSFPTENLCVPLLSPILATCPAYITLLYLITKITFLMNTDHKAPCYVVFSIPVTRSSQTQMSSSVPYTRTPSDYLPLSMWRTKLHTHTKNLQNYSFLTVANLLITKVT